MKLLFWPEQGRIWICGGWLSPTSNIVEVGDIDSCQVTVDYTTRLGNPTKLLTVFFGCDSRICEEYKEIDGDPCTSQPSGGAAIRKAA